MSNSLHRIRALLVVLVVASGCKTRNPDYCEGAPLDHCDNMDAQTCSIDEQCPESAPICDVGGTGRCVECTSSDGHLCSESEPVCGDDNACRGCIAHSECTESNACTPEGRCAASSEVAYVAAGGTGTTVAGCSKGAACPTLADAVGTTKQYIKVATGLIQDDQTTAIERVVTVLADPGARLDRTGDGVILEVRGNGIAVRIYDIEISGATGDPQGIGVLIPPSNTPLLTLSRVRVARNQAGGISINGGEFDINNSIIASNGSASSVAGGVQLNGTNLGARRFEFNTITNNVGADGSVTGVSCVNIVQALTVSNNVVFDNQGGGTRKQISDTTSSSNCSWTFSDIAPGAPISGNLSVDPMFVDAARGDFHLKQESPVRDMAAPGAAPMIDIDRDTRPQGDRSDMGADEIKL